MARRRADCRPSGSDALTLISATRVDEPGRHQQLARRRHVSLFWPSSHGARGCRAITHACAHHTAKCTLSAGVVVAIAAAMSRENETEFKQYCRPMAKEKLGGGRSRAVRLALSPATPYLLLRRLALPVHVKCLFFQAAAAHLEADVDSVRPITSPALTASCWILVVPLTLIYHPSAEHSQRLSYRPLHLAIPQPPSPRTVPTASSDARGHLGLL